MLYLVCKVHLDILAMAFPRHIQKYISVEHFYVTLNMTMFKIPINPLRKQWRSKSILKCSPLLHVALQISTIKDIIPCFELYDFDKIDEV